MHDIAMKTKNQASMKRKPEVIQTELDSHFDGFVILKYIFVVSVDEGSHSAVGPL